MGCGINASAIYGSTFNHTNQPISLDQVQIGPTNQWCNTPADDQDPGTGSSWKLGDNIFGSSVQLLYSLPGSEPPDEFEFDANVNFLSGGGRADCGPVTDGVFPPSGDYTCKATWSQSFSPHNALVTFQLFNARASSAGQSAAERRGHRGR